jgi:hypothetical protein
MTYEYTHTAEPDPAQAERERAHVRDRNREEHPTWAKAVDSVIAADLPLDDAAEALMRLRVRNMRGRRPVRESRAGR